MRHPFVLASTSAALVLGAFFAGCTDNFNQLHTGGGTGAGGMPSSGNLTTSSTSGSLATNTSSNSTTGASSTTSSGASSTTSSGSGMVENCTNSIDDDQNGMIDCADPACAAGFTCT